MAPRDVRALARRFFAAWHWDLSVIDELAAPDITVAYPLFGEVLHGAESFKVALGHVHLRFPDFSFVAEEPLVDGDRAAIAWRGGGTHSSRLLGVPATGRRLTWSGITLYHFQDGRVIAERGEEDVLSILRQMGVFPATPERASTPR
jgi:predicted ester cyclase